MPPAFLGHSNPMNALDHNRYTDAWRALGESVGRPAGVLGISAHWYTNATAVTSIGPAPDHPRLLRVPRTAVRDRLSGTGRPCSCSQSRRPARADLGGPGRRQLG